MISLIHPSRSRPQKSFNTYLKWRIHGGYKFILSLDEDDPLLNEYKKLYVPLMQLHPIVIIVNKNRSAVDAINNGAKDFYGDWLIVVSDDTECPEYWPDEIYKATEGKTDWILKTQDGIQPWIITMPIMDRAYYNRFGYIYHPDYLHMFADTELTCVADITGRRIKSNLLFPHKHYSVTKEQPDEVNKKADATWAQGEKLFLERYKRNFDLPPGKPIEDNGMMNWLKRKVR